MKISPRNLPITLCAALTALSCLASGCTAPKPDSPTADETSQRLLRENAQAETLEGIQAKLEGLQTALEAQTANLEAQAEQLKAQTELLHEQNSLALNRNQTLAKLLKATETLASRPTVAHAPPEAPAKAPPLDVTPLVKTLLPNTIHSLINAPLKGADVTQAKVAIVLFSDFQCPFCSKTLDTLRQIEETYKGDVVFAFRHYPLPFHANAIPAAKAAVAAQAQGQFWEMHDLLFGDQEHLDQATFVKYARKIGLDVERFKADMASEHTEAVITADRVIAANAEVEGTPTFLINGARLVGAMPFEAFKTLIDRNMAAVDGKVAKGMSVVQARGEVSALNIMRNPSRNGGSDDIRALRAVDIEGHPGKGAEDPLVVITEFSDFECPFCSKLGEPLARLLKEHPDELRVVFRNHPLGFHQHAHLAAEAGMAAAAQGKFWEMHDQMFAHQDALGREDLVGYAEAVGLDVEAFTTALDQGTYKAAVDKDANVGQGLGVEGTPAMFFNGRLVSGALPYEELKTHFDRAKKQAEGLISRGEATRKGFYSQLLTLIPAD